MFTYTHTRLLVEDYPAAVRFYRDVLGFEVSLGGEDSAYTEFRTGDVLLALFGRGMMADAVGTAHLPARAAAQDRVALCLAVEDVDAACEALAARGVALIVPPTDRTPWGLRTAHFRDPDGNLIEISHNIPMGEG